MATLHGNPENKSEESDDEELWVLYDFVDNHIFRYITECRPQEAKGIFEKSRLVNTLAFSLDDLQAIVEFPSKYMLALSSAEIMTLLDASEVCPDIRLARKGKQLREAAPEIYKRLSSTIKSLDKVEFQVRGHCYADTHNYLALCVSIFCLIYCWSKEDELIDTRNKDITNMVVGTTPIENWIRASEHHIQRLRDDHKLLVETPYCNVIDPSKQNNSPKPEYSRFWGKLCRTNESRTFRLHTKVNDEEISGVRCVKMINLAITRQAVEYAKAEDPISMSMKRFATKTDEFARKYAELLHKYAVAEETDTGDLLADDATKVEIWMKKKSQQINALGRIEKLYIANAQSGPCRKLDTLIKTQDLLWETYKNFIQYLCYECPVLFLGLSSPQESKKVSNKNLSHVWCEAISKQIVTTYNGEESKEEKAQHHRNDPRHVKLEQTTSNSKAVNLKEPQDRSKPWTTNSSRLGQHGNIKSTLNLDEADSAQLQKLDRYMAILDGWGVEVSAFEKVLTKSQEKTPDLKLKPTQKPGKSMIRGNAYMTYHHIPVECDKTVDQTLRLDESKADFIRKCYNSTAVDWKYSRGPVILLDGYARDSCSFAEWFDSGSTKRPPRRKSDLMTFLKVILPALSKQSPINLEALSKDPRMHLLDRLRELFRQVFEDHLYTWYYPNIEQTDKSQLVKLRKWSEIGDDVIKRRFVLENVRCRPETLPNYFITKSGSVRFAETMADYEKALAKHDADQNAAKHSIETEERFT